MLHHMCTAGDSERINPPRESPNWQASTVPGVSSGIRFLGMSGKEVKAGRMGEQAVKRDAG